MGDINWELPVPLEQLKFNEAVPFNVNVNRDLLVLTQKKLALARLPEEQIDPDEDNYPQGARLARMKRLKHLNTVFNNFLVKIDVPDYGPLVLHYTHTKSSSPTAIPLLFSHGWPGSWYEAVRIVQPLSNPPSPSDPSFHVVTPSIPGFRLSPAPKKAGVGPYVTARAFTILMTDVLGYSKGFVTQGGDFGSFITRAMAIQYPNLVRAQHVNIIPVNPPTLTNAPLACLRLQLSSILYSDWERGVVATRKLFEDDQSSYLHQQRTRPQTLGFALGDSPVGLLAWFVEKFDAWVGVKENFSETDIVNLAMTHWIAGPTPALRFYREAFGRGRNEAFSTWEKYVAIPTGASMFPKEVYQCPRDWAAQAANIQSWKEHSFGGHFAALERPDQLAADMREFFSSDVVQQELVEAGVLK